MKTSIQNKLGIAKVEVLTVSEAHDAGYLTYQEYIDHNTWHKSSIRPIEDKYFIYVNGVFAEVLYGEMPSNEVINQIAEDNM